MPPSDTNDFDNLGLPALESKLKTDLKCLLYDGKNWAHWNKPINGDKYSIVAYYRYGKGRKNIIPTEPTLVTQW